MEQETRPRVSSSERMHKVKALSLDLSRLPPLEQPTPPSNTLIITNLQSKDIFRPDNLQEIRDLMSKTAPIHSWAPLKSFSRIIVSFFDQEAAIKVRQVWDGEAILGHHCKIYFGKDTPIEAQEHVHLELPDAGKLFFISPPPSPPHGWEMRLEDAPNKMVHAEDLADALAKLRHQAAAVDVSPLPVSPSHSNTSGMRSRSSTLIFQPQVEKGNSPDLPCVMVDDMTDEPDVLSMSPLAMEPKPILAHTMRPPVELTLDA
jgi:hypothetical protein